MKLDFDKLDFDYCEDEPIHTPELIQGFGYLLALDPETAVIKIVSENIDGLFGRSEALIGASFIDLLEDKHRWEFLSESYQRAVKNDAKLPLQINFGVNQVTRNRKRFYYAVVYDSNGLMIVELEPSDQFRETYSAQQHMKLYAASIAPRFELLKSLNEMADEIVTTIRQVTQMERVVLYKFSEDGSGTVIAEAKADHMSSYMNLRYPSTDIPKQARQLYLKNWVRLMANVNMKPSRLIPTVEESGRAPIDMTHSLLRELSPIHKQYIRNQGLHSTISMSLVTHGNVWGMIFCHSLKPRYIAQNVRLECENLSQLFSWHLYAKEEELFIQRTKVTDQFINKILELSIGDMTIVEIFEQRKEEVLSILNADGFVFFTDVEQIQIGNTPKLSTLKELYYKRCHNDREVFHTEALSELTKDVNSLNESCGMLMTPMGVSSHYFTAWFRNESPFEEKWAGIPKERSPNASKAERLRPRSSFDVHSILTRGKSKVWDNFDIDVAMRFNRIFMGYAFEKQKELNSSINNLKLQNKYIDDFLATLAHELRNPLASIKMALQLSDVDKSEERKAQYSTTMNRQVSHMTTMINDLMDVSRITQNKVNIETKLIDLRTILDEIVDTCKPLTDTKRHTVELTLPDSPCMINGDYTRLSQVFVNLLNNAAKYTEEGGQIEITSSCEDEKAIVKITDNGIGIDPLKLDDIFTLFIQVDKFQTKSGSGLGIGLTLVKQLIEIHGGEISAYSEGLGKGSTFTVTLPQAKVDQNASDTSTGLKASNSTDASTKMYKVLIVDDNEALASMLKILLEQKEYTAKVAINATEAIRMYETYEPHFAILDIGLPEMDGFELFEKLKAFGVPTAFFSHSGLSDANTRAKSVKLGFKEHFVKPLDQASLFKALSENKPNEL
jgi:light-regulated signal transduction histidine kinase (bacteriophytochrome)/ActR/RegA family two-component response regulator